MLARARNYSFISCSLSLLGGRQVKISERQYAAYIRAYAAKLIKYPNLSIVLISREDMAPLPEINCWCKQNSWVLQMDEQGFRLSDESSIVNAAAFTLERCIRRVPPERKEKKYVERFLLELAQELENRGGQI